MHFGLSALTLGAMNQIIITKEQALACYQGNGSALARALGISAAAVSQWPDGPIGQVHALKLRFLLKPDVFGSIEPDVAKAG